MDQLLGRPKADPHGDPIPSPGGKLAAGAACSLAACLPGKTVRVARVTDQDGHFLHFVERQGLVPGAKLTVQRHDPDAEAVVIQRVGGEVLALGNAAAEKIMVETDGK
jgi:DtxR family Mn-dependent transcriptional regulator